LGGDYRASLRGQPMQVYSGGLFHPLDPRREEIFLQDIMHALSNLCRFGGHVPKFYSVAQHSILVSQVVPPEFAREGLLHDAAEAYLGDLIRPLKHVLPAYTEAEERMQAVIADRFGLLYPFPPEVGEGDNVVLATEKRDLLPAADWGWMPEPLEEVIRPMTPNEAGLAFRDRCLTLGVS